MLVSVLFGYILIHDYGYRVCDCFQIIILTLIDPRAEHYNAFARIAYLGLAQANDRAIALFFKQPSEQIGNAVFQYDLHGNLSRCLRPAPTVISARRRRPPDIPE